MKNNFFTNIKNLSLSLLLALSCLFSLNSTVQAQVSAYTVTQGAGAYTLYVPAQGGGALANATTTWDNTGAAFVMPWNMYYNADTYIAGSDNFLAYTNGWIKFGHGLTATFFSTHTNGDLITTGTDPNSFGMNANWAAQTWATTTGTWTLGASSMVVASAANISAGMTIYATGLPVGTIVTSVAGTTVNFSTVATAAGTAAVVTPRSGFWVFTIGTAPNRTMIVQYTKVRRSTNPAFATPDPATATTANFNFQIRFNEGGGIAANQSVMVQVGTMVASSATVSPLALGLVGNSSADFSTRASATATVWNPTTLGIVSSQLLNTNAATYPAVGYGYVWTPPAACSSAPTGGTITGIAPASGTYPLGTAFTLTVTGASAGSPGLSYTWETGPTAGGPWTVLQSTGSPVLNWGVANVATTFYRCVTTCAGFGSTATSNAVSYTGDGTTVLLASNSTVNTCGGTIYDDGGAAGNYLLSRTYIMTLNPTTVGSFMKLTMTSFASENNFDFLYIYNGPTIFSPLLATLTNAPALAAYTSTDPSGKLTLRWVSDVSTVNTGFSGTLQCVQPCSSGPVTAGTTVANPSSGWCLGSTINLSNTGTSTGSDLLYQWQYSNNGTVWSNLGSGQTNSTSSATITAAGNNYYRCVVTCTASSSTVGTTPVNTIPGTCLTHFNGSVSTCAASYYDPGGSAGQYANSTNQTLTINPSTAGSFTRIVFNTYATESGWDYIYVYNGPNTTYPQIAVLTGSGGPVTYTSTESTTGALTIQFTSDGSFVANGWDATVSCVTPCNATPPAGTAVATPNNPCFGAPFNLSVTGGSTASGVTFQWQSSPDNSTWTNILLATSPTLTGVTTFSTTYYRLVSTCTGFGTPIGSVSATVTPNTTCIQMADGSITTCSATFTDEGGAGGNYTISKIQTLRIFPTIGNILQFDLTAFATEQGYDTLHVYNGAPAIANEVATLHGNGIGGGVYNGATLITLPYQYISGALDGSISFRWRSDASVVYAGWAASVSCVPSCTSPVTPGTAVASVASACNAVPFNLSLIGSSTGTGLSYQWETSPNNTAWTAVSGATNATYVGVTQSVQTYYRCVLSCAYGGSTLPSNSANVPMNSLLNCYCNGAFTSAFTGDAVTYVGLFGECSKIDHSHPTNGLFTNFAPVANQTTVSLYKNTSYDVTISVSTDVSGQNTQVWIDYNQNGVFEATEALAPAPINVAPSGSTTINFLVPAGALTGATGMRVRGGSDNSNAMGNANACTVYLFGETQNYQINILTAVTCSGLPAPLATITSANSVCSGVPFQLSVAGTDCGTGISYAWQSSPNGTAWTNITGATQSTYTATQATATYYRLNVTCSSSGQTGTSTGNLQVTMNSVLNCFCVPTYTNGTGSGDYITSVDLNSTPAIVSASVGAASPYYTYFTGVGNTGTVDPGSSYTLTVGMGPDLSGQWAGVWADWNGNGSLLDAGEYMGSMNVPANGTLSMSIVVPVTATAGVARLRIRGGDDVSQNSNQPCGPSNSSFGETEDYDITISALADCAGAPPATTVNTTLSPTTNGALFTLSLTGAGISTGPFIAGYVYEWQISTDNVSWSIIPSGNTNPFVTSQTSSNYYRCHITCSVSGQDNYSNSLLIKNNPYCAPSTTLGSTTYGDYINTVKIEDYTGSDVMVNAGTGAAPFPYFTNYSATVSEPNITANSFFWLKLTGGPGAALYSEVFHAYIDWNSNGTFDGGIENIAQQNGGFIFQNVLSIGAETYMYVETPAIGSTVVGFPANPVTTGLKRLRIRSSSTSGTFTPCGTTELSGEIEDYDINLVNPACVGASISPNLTSYAPNQTTVNDRIVVTLGGTPVGGFKKFEYCIDPSFNPGSFFVGQFIEHGNIGQSVVSFVDNVNPAAGQLYVRGVIQKDGCPVAYTSTMLIKTSCATPYAYWTQFDDYITSIEIRDNGTNALIGTVQNSAAGDNGYGRDGYEDFRAHSWDLNKNHAYKINITCNGTGAAFSESRAVWIDFDGNGVYTTGENIYTVAGPSGTLFGTTTAVFTLPCTVPDGPTTMRVAIAYEPTNLISSNPCAAGFYYYGQIEEYTFDVQPVATLPVVPLSAVCVGNSAQLLASSCTSYQWSPINGQTVGTTTYSMPLFTPAAGNTAGLTVTTGTPADVFFTVTGTLASGGTIPGAGCATSAVVPVTTFPIAGAITPSGSVVCAGGSKILTATGAAGNYQWQYSNDNISFTDIPGATTTIYTATLPGSGAGSTGRYYRLLSKSFNCFDISSNSALVSLSTTPGPVSPATSIFTSVTASTVTVNWAPTGGGSYSVAYSCGALTGTLLLQTPPVTINPGPSGLPANTNCLVTITQTSLPSCGGVNPYSETAKTMCAKPAAGQPALVSATANTITVAIPAGTWKLYTSVVGIGVYNASACLTGPMNYTIGPASASALSFYLKACNCPTNGVDNGEPGAPVVYYFNPSPVTCGTSIPTAVVTNSCPNQINVGSITGNPTNQYVVTVRRLSPNPSGGASFAVNGTTFNYTTGGSQGSQFWEVYIRNKCGTGPSYTYSQPSQFYQIEVKGTCPKIQNLVLSHPLCGGFTATWNTVLCGGAAPTSYQLFTKAGAGNWNSYNSATNVKTLNIWGTGVTVQAYVRANTCNGSFGPNSDIQTIVTACREEETELQPEEGMFDSGITTDDGTISVYPNPNQGTFQLDLQMSDMTTQEVRIEVINMLGQTVLTQISNMSDGHFNDNVMLPQSVTSGNYMVRVFAGTKAVFNTKVNISK